MQIDWPGKLRHFLQVVAFCLGIAALHYAFQPQKSFAVPAAYSLAIGTLTWLIIDFGRHAFASSQETGWPMGLASVALPMAGIVLGYLGGTVLGDWWTGISSWEHNGGAQLRISLGITVVAGLIGTGYFYNRGKTAWLQARVAEVRAQATEAQLKLLQTQLEPHMLFNTLANLRVLIGTDPVRAQEMLDRMIAYLRATLGASRSAEHALDSEFARLRDYLELMAIRMGPRLTYTLELPQALRNAAVPPLLLQPLVENAIRHGLEPQVAGGCITVRASARPGGAGSSSPGLLLEVVDTGAGLPETLPAPGAGGSFGIAQVRERLASLYGPEGTLELIATGACGTSARAQFPLKFTAAAPP